MSTHANDLQTHLDSLKSCHKLLVEALNNEDSETFSKSIQAHYLLLNITCETPVMSFQ